MTSNSILLESIPMTYLSQYSILDQSVNCYSTYNLASTWHHLHRLPLSYKLNLSKNIFQGIINDLLRLKLITDYLICRKYSMSFLLLSPIFRQIFLFSWRKLHNLHYSSFLWVSYWIYADDSDAISLQIHEFPLFRWPDMLFNQLFQI